MNLPLVFEEKMRNLLKEEFDAYIACYEEPRYYGLRVNTRKLSAAEFEKICPFAVRPVPWIHNGFYYDGEAVSPAKHPYYFAGLYYLQEPSAMTPASRLPIELGTGYWICVPRREERLRNWGQDLEAKVFLLRMISAAPGQRGFSRISRSSGSAMYWCPARSQAGWSSFSRSILIKF